MRPRPAMRSMTPPRYSHVAGHAPAVPDPAASPPLPLRLLLRRRPATLPRYSRPLLRPRPVPQPLRVYDVQAQPVPVHRTRLVPLPPDPRQVRQGLPQLLGQVQCLGAVLLVLPKHQLLLHRAQQLTHLRLLLGELA